MCSEKIEKTASEGRRVGFNSREAGFINSPLAQDSVFQERKVIQ